jgi:hypothetical protein
MQGRRVLATPEGFLRGMNQPGDFGRVTAEMPKGCERQLWWQVIAPDGSQCSLNPDIHSVEEHGDGTITVQPSIVTATWHGWLERGTWRSV